MHYVVTGGAGFIGSRVVNRLLEMNPAARITCIDNFDPFYAVAVKQSNIRQALKAPGFHLLDVDIAATPAASLAALIPEPVDVIIHLAAKAGVRPSILDPLGYQQSNISGLQHMLDFAREKRTRQFVFASSSSVYGINDHYPWKEDEKLMPISPYAMTKLAGEMLGHVYHKLYDIRFIALRFFTVYGPGQRPDLAIHKFTKAILDGQPITMYGDGSTSRDYTYVDDTVQGVIAATKYSKSDFEIINLGNNHAVSLRELIVTIENVLGKKAIIEQQPEQPGDVARTFADISKAKRLLDYQPHTLLEDGLYRFRDWFVANRELFIVNS